MMLRLSFRRIKLFHNEFPLEKQLNLTKRCLSDHVSGNNSGQEIQVPHKGSYRLEDCDNRREWVEQVTSASLSNVGQWWNPKLSQGYTTENLKGNIENPIGLAKIPQGVAGPLLIKGDHVHNEMILCPIATTEGAIVASTSRGAKAITRCGGVSTRVIKRRIQRVPYFVTDSMQQAQKLSHWLLSHFDELKAKAGEVSQHCKLQSLQPWFIGRNVMMEFVYDSADAAGQNAVTVTTWYACDWAKERIAQECPDINIREYYIETKFSGDKNNIPKNYVTGRGIEVQAETYITESTLKSVLKIDSKKLVKAFNALALSAQRSGSCGINQVVSNTLAAIFTATGQDIACVHESSWSVFEISAEEEIRIQATEHRNAGMKSEAGIYACLVLPTLLIGTVGGGTYTPTAKESLNMLGCLGKGRIYRFAEIIASFALAMEISALSAIASDQFASAHDRLGRNRPE
ncbi:unnamed protein product [Pocillopora meandrina]|uniref:hydroxymethylglutaryl-CoA reductase (NADPH) n=1 Tax=Pocillopora meandrina TaxID=46732 RepID=A0AAU9W8S3_9CNID|nr:unnamed protein product [Pocillopora meandrina]